MIFAASAASAVVLAKQEPVKYAAGGSPVRVLPGLKPRRKRAKKGDAMSFTYGWCAYCPNFTYHDLDRGPDGKQPGACADCVARWREFPQTCPPNRRESR